MEKRSSSRQIASSNETAGLFVTQSKLGLGTQWRWEPLWVSCDQDAPFCAALVRSWVGPTCSTCLAVTVACALARPFSFVRPFFRPQSRPFSKSAVKDKAFCVLAFARPDAPGHEVSADFWAWLWGWRSNLRAKDDGDKAAIAQVLQ